MTHSTTTLPAAETSPTSPAPALGWGDSVTPPTPCEPGWASATVNTPTVDRDLHGCWAACRR
jgi:hypothetical protein